MIKKKFNIIEISVNKKNPEFIIIEFLFNKENIKFIGVESIKEFLEFLKKIKKKGINIYIIDTAFLLPLILKEGGKEIKNVDFLGIKSNIYKFSFKLGNKQIIFTSLTRLLSINLVLEKKYNYKQLYFGDTPRSGEIFYTPNALGNNVDERNESLRIYIEQWQRGMVPAIENYEKEIMLPSTISKILKNNTIVLEKILMEVDKNLSGLIENGEGKTSISSIAHKIYNEKFNKFKIKIRNQTHTDDLLRPAYYGGRCEVIGNACINTERIYHYDYKSMYASVMTDNYPTGDFRYENSIKDINTPGFYYITYKSDNEIPVLPHKRSNGLEIIDGEGGQSDMLFFTNGDMEGLYGHEEIKLAIENGVEILEIKYAYLYDRENRIFKEFAEQLMLLKEETRFFIGKNILVSFYGRLGMSPKDTKLLLVNEKEYQGFLENLKEYQEILNETGIYGYCLSEIKTKKEEEVNSRVDLAAIITSKARIKLYSSYLNIKKEGGRLLYGDTDSLFIAFPKNEKIIGTNKGGVFWDPNDSKTRIKEGVFASTRCYSIKYENDGETKIAGIPRNSINFEQFKETFFSPSTNYIKFELFKKRISNYKEGTIPVFTNLESYKKRYFNHDKKKTKPYGNVSGDLIRMSEIKIIRKNINYNGKKDKKR